MNPQELCKLMESGTCIAILWCVEDVKEVRPDLDDAQCLAVLQECEHRHDAYIGINWEVIEIHAESLFPVP